MNETVAVSIGSCTPATPVKPSLVQVSIVTTDRRSEPGGAVMRTVVRFGLGFPAGKFMGTVGVEIRITLPAPATPSSAPASGASFPASATTFTPSEAVCPTANTVSWLV